MNGMSDVRLMLHGQELQALQGPFIKMRCAPASSRWGVFRHRWVTRKVLLELDADQLRDVGISWEQARAEGLKPFWRD
ncbi:DUF1127 domain-containing protein [Pseudomonas sp. CCI3.2]|uniref:DUF1127 domain-containing protein n=1 Tax=unclassified Pseudomonas TaxID=196821 RepID=UPI002AC947CC|nr:MULTISPECIES: DUF1127 domain-containing protein [unclassified Pseudomonas]MEB0077846.1 DUF1127 domain-containing protein [Pseudomonas sp. MH10out]MEB0102943.1 DUF1127 domain-containing protein [Pseudomonas sp. CCI3.2]MEB0131666.1 DUF1127 domain-containing protein [Pseudomonas sp. CCI2.4]MEB0159619.1 DUF1127 domain-containing protein [Pseudomonas sp. AH2 (2023)]MEB0169521.1 DUF1127 domain-containing protein [Pseudomonas sp. CCC4.4]